MTRSDLRRLLEWKLKAESYLTACDQALSTKHQNDDDVVDDDDDQIVI